MSKVLIDDLLRGDTDVKVDADGDSAQIKNREVKASTPDDPSQILEVTGAVGPAVAAASAKEGNEQDMEEIVRNALIYVVDDDDIVRIMMGEGFKRCGFRHIKVFRDGDEVIPAMFDAGGKLREIPDVILCDTEMARMGGLELYKRIRLLGKTVQPLFVATSGNHNIREEWGDVPFIEKPFMISEVVKDVTHELKQKKGFLKN